MAASFGALALEIGFAFFALSRRLRPATWLAMLGMHAGLILLIDFADLSVGMLVLHAFTFDPAWCQGWRSRYEGVAGEPKAPMRAGSAGAAVAGLLILPSLPVEAAPRGETADVIITNDGIRHAGLVLYGEDGPREYGFGDLDWFALGRTQTWRAPATLLLPSQAVFSRRPLPDAELARLGSESGILCRRYTAPVARIEALQAVLDAPFESSESEAHI